MNHNPSHPVTRTLLLAASLSLPSIALAQTPPPSNLKKPPATASSTVKPAAPKEEPGKKQSAPADVPAGTPAGSASTPAGQARGSAAVTVDGRMQTGRSAADAKGTVGAAQEAIGARNAELRESATLRDSIGAPAFNQGFADKNPGSLQGVVQSGNPLAPVHSGTAPPPGASSAVGSGLVSDCAAGTTTSATGACTNADGEVSGKGKASDAGAQQVERQSPHTGSTFDEDQTRSSSDGRNVVKVDLNGTKHVFVNGQEVGRIYSGGTVVPTGSSCPPDLDGCSSGDKLTWMKNLQTNINYQIKVAAKKGSNVTPTPNEDGFAVAPGTVAPSQSQMGQNLFGNPGSAAVGVNVGGATASSGFGRSQGLGTINPGPDGSSGSQTGGRTEDPGQFFDRAPSASLDSRPGAQCDADGRTADTSDDCPKN